MNIAERLVLGTSLIVAVGWAPFACSGGRALSPTTRDALVQTALDEARYQCVTSPPTDARLQAGCVALLDADALVAPKPSGSAPPTRPDSASPAPGPTQDAGLAVTPGNAVRNVE